jgi:hypothetical protein
MTNLLQINKIKEATNIILPDLLFYDARVRIRYRYPVPVLIRGTTFLKKVRYGYVNNFFFI